MAKNLKWYQKHFLWRRLCINRRYKDRLFRFLFRDKKDLLELYNAVNGSAYSNADDMEIVTLEDAIFMKMKNDLSFIISIFTSIKVLTRRTCPCGGSCTFPGSTRGLWHSTRISYTALSL